MYLPQVFLDIYFCIGKVKDKLFDSFVNLEVCEIYGIPPIPIGLSEIDKGQCA